MASLADTPAYAAEVSLVERIAGPMAGDVLRLPFSLGDAERLRTHFTAAGIPHAQIALQQGTGRFQPIRKMVEVDVRDWLALMGVVLEEDVIERILRESDEALVPHVTVDANGVTFASPAVVVSAVKT